jgi:hypothetical protein
MKVKELRNALEGVDGEMEVLVRSQLLNDDLVLCALVEAQPDAGCAEDEMFVLDAEEGQAEE